MRGLPHSKSCTVSNCHVAKTMPNQPWSGARDLFQTKNILQGCNSNFFFHRDQNQNGPKLQGRLSYLGLISIIIMFVKQNKKTIIIVITNLRVLIIIIITKLRVLVKKKNYRYHYNKLKVFAVLFGSILKQNITGYNIKIKCNSVWLGWLFLQNSIQQKRKDESSWC